MDDDYNTMMQEANNLPEISISIKNKIAYPASAKAFIVRDNSDYVVNFEFDSEWDVYAEAAKTARFAFGGGYVDVPFTGNSVNVPIISKGREVNIGVFAGNLSTTTPASFPLLPSIRSKGGAPIEPESSVYDKIMALIKSGGVDPEVIANAIETYLAEHPIAETDPTVPAWAKAATKPTYTASEVGALSDTTVIPSVDGMLKYTAQSLTDAQKQQARANIGAGTSSFDGNYNSLSNKPTIPAQVAIDSTLKQSGKAADAKAVGDALTEVDTKLDEKQPKGNYLTTESDPSVPAWAKSPTKPTYTASEVGAISQDDLQSATNAALAQAKASGEFKGDKGDTGVQGIQGIQGIKGDTGEKGADGISVTVASVTESTTDGGNNVVTFSDGKTVTIKNGTKGSTGAKGDKGDTGAKGADGANFAWNLASGTANGEGWSKTSFDAAERTFSRSTTATSEGYIQRTVSLTAGKTYTFSAYLWSNGKVTSADIFAYDKTVKDVYQKSSITLTTSPVLYSLTFTPKTNSAYDWTNAAIRFDNNGSTASGTQAILYAKDVKLEEGSVATPWCTTQAETIGKDGSDASVTKANVVAALGYTPAQSGNCVTYTSHANVTVGKKEGVTTYTYGQSPMVVSNGVIIGGSAQNAGLVTRGICGVTTPDDTGACSLESLYINYDGDNKYTRAMVLGAGSAGNDITTSTATSTEATKVYGTTQAAVRGDQMVNYVTAKISGKQDKSTLETDVAAKGFTKNTGTYSKPSGGIPKSDLASAVQTSLGRADTLTDAYINNLINTALGVIENANY